jgi:hypothetical protein
MPSLGYTPHDSAPAAAAMGNLAMAPMLTGREVDVLFTLSEIRLFRRTFGNDIPMIIDLNCNWSEQFTRQVITERMDLNCPWLEKPVIPHEAYYLQGKEAERAVKARQTRPQRLAGHNRPLLRIVDCPRVLGFDHHRANDTVLTIARIETGTAVDNLEAILGVEEIQSVYIGPSDLSLALGRNPASTRKTRWYWKE